MTTVFTGHRFNDPAFENELDAARIQIEASPGRRVHIVGVYVDPDGFGGMGRASSKTWTRHQAEAVADALDKEAARVRHAAGFMKPGGPNGN